ncbi:MAG: hypothetical protein Q7T21_03100 [Gallionella sp.]|nr:hypothetical protein [Gallionella sp.]
MQSAHTENLGRLRVLADNLDCLTEEDFQLLAEITPGTAEAWRKRRKGPEYIRIGNRVLYPRKAVAKHLESLTRECPALGKALL